MIHVPLLFVGNLIKPRIITKQVRHVDIFPTIFDLIDIPLDIKISGKSLVSTTNEISEEEESNYLHTMPFQKESTSDRIGIRTNKYKYFRNSKNPKKDIHLYDLENDIYENNNILKNNLPIIEKMEKLLQNMQNDTLELDNTLSKEEEEKISKELRKLGYT